MATQEVLKIRAGLESGTGYTRKPGDKFGGPRLGHLLGRKHNLTNIHINQAKAATAYRRLKMLGLKAEKQMEELTALVNDKWSGPNAGKGQGWANETSWANLQCPQSNEHHCPFSCVELETPSPTETRPQC